jgi:hypothetical protein
MRTRIIKCVSVLSYLSNHASVVVKIYRKTDTQIPVKIHRSMYRIYTNCGEDTQKYVHINWVTV